MRKTPRSLARCGMLAALSALPCLLCPVIYGLAFVAPIGADNASRPRPAITLARPAQSPTPSPQANSALAPGADAADMHSEARRRDAEAHANYREFTPVRIGQAAEPERFTLEFHATTTVASIAATADFHVSGGTCIEGHAYLAGDVCNVEVTLTPTGPGHRSGQLLVAHSASVTPFFTPLGGNSYGPAVSFTPSQIATVPGTTVSGAGILGGSGGLGVDGGDNLYIADYGNNLIRLRDSSGALTTVVGGGTISPVNNNPNGLKAKLNGPSGVVSDNFGGVHITDTNDNALLNYYADSIVVSAVGGGVNNYAGCTLSSPCSNNVELSPPSSIAADASGNIYISILFGGNLPGTVFGEYTYTSIPANFYTLGATAYNYYSTSYAMTVDPFGYGNLYYTYLDPGGPLLSPTPLCYIFAQNSAYSNGASSGQRFWTVAGSGQCGFSGDGGKAGSAEISKAIGAFAWDAAGNFYFTDTGNNRVRRIDGLTGVIHTIAGNGGTGTGGDGGPSTSASIQAPFGLGVDSTGRVYTTGVTSGSSSTVKTDIRMFGTIGQLNFGNQATGSSSVAQTVLVSNVGNDTLNFTHSGFSSGNTGDFVVDPNTTSCNFTVSLGSGKSCTVGFLFSPSASGARSAVFSIEDDTVSGVNTIQLSGVGSTTATLTPASLSFASTTVGAMTAAQTATLTNTGTGALNITGISFSGGGAASFAETTTCGSTLAAGANCTFAITFKPTAVGALTASLVVVDNATGGQQTVSLAGTGVAAAAHPVLAPTSLTFASQTVGSTSAAQSIKLSNTGGSALGITSITMGGTNPADFPFTQNCGSSLAAGGACLVSVTFKPAASGARAATVSFVTSTGSFTAAVSGSGAAAAAKAALTPTPVTFSAQTVGTASASKSFTLSNTGGSPLTISGYAISGTNATDFTQTHTCGTTLAAATSCTINVVFKPAGTGARSATLAVNTSVGFAVAGIAGSGAAAAITPRVDLVSLANPLARNQTLVLHVNVLGPAKTPTGNVQLREGNLLRAEGALVHGLVTFRLVNLTEGVHMLNAVYLGDTHTPAASSGALRQVVAPIVMHPRIANQSDPPVNRQQ